MNRSFKIFGRLLLGMALIFIIACLSFYWFVSTRWKKYYTKNEIKEYVKIIENSPTLSNNLYAIYDKLNNNDRHKSITEIYTEALWNEIILKRHRENTCWFVRVADDFALLKAQKRERFQGFILAWGLEKYTTSEKCFDFAQNQYNKELMKDYKDSTLKDITKLKDTNEILKYYLITKTPSRYIRNPELLKIRTEELRNRLEKL